MTIQRIYRTFIYILETFCCFFTVSRKRQKFSLVGKSEKETLKF